MRQRETFDTTIYDESAPRLYFIDLKTGKAWDIPRDAIDEILNGGGNRIVVRTHGEGEYAFTIYRGSRQCTAMEFEKMLDWYQAGWWDKRLGANIDYYTPDYRAAQRKRTA